MVAILAKIASQRNEREHGICDSSVASPCMAIIVTISIN